MSSASKKKRRKRRPRALTPAGQSNAQTNTEPNPAPPRARRPEPEGRPPAPWGSFPLVEIVVLIGIVMLVAGAIVGTDEVRGQTLIGTGLALASLAGLELSIREHFGGFRSHTALLASVAAVATMLALYYLGDLETTPSLIGGAIVGLASGLLLVRAFRARSGGRSVKLR